MPDDSPEVHGPETEAVAEPPKAAPAPEPAEDWPTRFKYLLADFENYRRRSERDRDTARQSARADVLRGLIPLYETFEHGLNAARRLDRENPLREGLELLSREWKAFWKSEGVEPVARTGDPFEADRHEAVGEAAPTDVASPGTIVEVVQQGYRSPAGLLRPAKVIVARQPAPTSAKPVGETTPDAGEKE